MLSAVSLLSWTGSDLICPSHTQAKTMKTALRPEKFDERGGNVINTGKMQFSSSLYVLARFSLRLTNSHFLNTRLITRALCPVRSDARALCSVHSYFISTTIQIAPVSRLPFTTFSLRPFWSYTIPCAPRSHSFCKFFCVSAYIKLCAQQDLGWLLFLLLLTNTSAAWASSRAYCRTSCRSSWFMFKSSLKHKWWCEELYPLFILNSLNVT